MRVFAMMLLMLAALPGQGSQWQENEELAAVFAEVKGTFVLHDVAAERYQVHDRARAERRFVPASTFKVVNSLIGLSVGAVQDVSEVIPYDGRPVWRQAWARDMDLRQAIKVSNVALYQVLAERIGLERMAENVRRLGYGNQDVGDKVNRFWLDGPLAISAREQVDYLAKLALGKLPFPAKAQAQVRDILLLEQGDGWRLYGKTGMGPGKDSKWLGWWVGWVEKEGRVYSFALNVDMADASLASKRIELGQAALRALGVL
ncbi:class D beta-lactamase [Gallaecimonas sp. GXIMD4217]|uniref:class D beta-lactamase n=1 Tax=Gallaecimonas sp. GXIMD4217 TaxID=3131927 RepID=UPI00311AED45